MQYTINLSTLKSFWETILSECISKNKHIILLHGDLGTGKTTSVKIIGEILGIDTPILSPTFVIMKTYETKHHYYKKLVHIDAYRVTDGSLFKTLNLKEFISKKDTLFCIEWPQYISELALFPHVRVQLNHTSENNDNRLIEITHHEDTH